jgi:glycosyltransferase involved in cell wall biosynthesis
LCDIKDWAFDNIAKSFIKHNPYKDKIEYEIKYRGDITNISEVNIDAYDYIYVFFEAERLISPSKKVIRGCYSAFWLENPRFTESVIAAEFSLCAGSVYVNKFLQDSVAQHLPKEHPTIIINDSSDESLFYRIEDKKKDNFTVIFVGNTKRKVKNFDIIEWICREAEVELIVCENIKNEELVNYYNAADISINFSEFEGGPQTFIESALCGVPMLVRNNNELGKLIPCFRGETKEEFVNIIKSLKDNRERCKIIGEEARLAALEDFTYKEASTRFGNFVLSLENNNKKIEKKDLSNELIVFIVSCGFNPNYEECKKSLLEQSVNFKMREIKDVSPMSAAFQKMIDECDTDYYIQVDEDMILYKDSIEIIYDLIKNSDLNISTISHMLKDVHLDFNLHGIKGYKHKILKNYPYNLEIISCEVEQIKRLQNDGYQALMVEKVLGYHSPKWTPDLIYERYFDLMEKYKNFKYNWLDELPSKLFQILQKDPSDINFYALMGAMNSLLSKEPIRKREKNFTIADENFELLKKIVEYKNFTYIMNREF